MSLYDHKSSSSYQHQSFLKIDNNQDFSPKLETNNKKYLDSIKSKKNNTNSLFQPIQVKAADGSKLYLMGMKLDRLLHWELFKERNNNNDLNFPIFQLCYQQWTNLAKVLAIVPQSIEFLMIVGNQPQPEDQGENINNFSAKVSFCFWVIGRGNNFQTAQKSAENSFRQFQYLINSHLDFVGFDIIRSDSHSEISLLKTYLTSSNVLEIRRRYEDLELSYSPTPTSPTGNFGFQLENEELSLENPPQKLKIKHLYPCKASNDSWQKLLYMYEQYPNSGALIVHFQGIFKVPSSIQKEAYLNLANIEKLLNTQAQEQYEGNTIITSQASIIRDIALQRLNFLKGSVLAARVFIVTPQPPLAETIALISGSIEQSHSFIADNKSEMLFCGGIKTIPSSAKEILKSLNNLNQDDFDLLFAPSEASSIFRTPMPCGEELPEIFSIRSRTATMIGNTGNDCLLGINRHRSLDQDVVLDDLLRFRHSYIIGQTGTGKSTLLANMIIQDIKKGRGVAVLDPHGTLIDDILEHYPQDRVDDLVIVDVTDTQRPIGFNILRIIESDPFQYKLKRDLLIDELFAYLDRTYDLKKTGGPIFETHFRSSMALLLGSKPQDNLIPNFMIFRALYTNPDLRSFLAAIEDDQVIIDFVEEAERTGGEASLDNLAPYITSKFSRFISDTALRNITCQNSILDIDAIVNEGKVLLFNLGKARFGSQAAGLLSSQIVSRLCNAAMKRGVGGNPFYLYADEFQLFADERFTEILAEARKFNLSVTVAHQYISQLPPSVLTAILGNVGTIIALRVGAVDAPTLESIFMPTFKQRDLSNLPNYSAYVKSSGILGETPFSMELLPLPEDGNKKQVLELHQMSRLKYGRDYREVEKEINEMYKKYNKLLF